MANVLSFATPFAPHVAGGLWGEPMGLLLRLLSATCLCKAQNALLLQILKLGTRLVPPATHGIGSAQGQWGDSGEG